MRVLVAALLAFALAGAAAEHHVHAPSSGGEGCAVCVLRHAEVPRDPVADVAPAIVDAGEVPGSPGLPPVTGAPLGAIPGQSPPAGA